MENGRLREAKRQQATEERDKHALRRMMKEELQEALDEEIRLQ